LLLIHRTLQDKRADTGGQNGRESRRTPASQLTQQQLLALPLIVGAGVIAIYPVAIALARPSLAGFRGTGMPLPMIFAVTAIAAIAALVTCASLIASRRASPDQSISPAHALPSPHARPSTAVDLPRHKTARHDDEDEPGAQSDRRRP
jgi:hypothetical protein